MFGVVATFHHVSDDTGFFGADNPEKQTTREHCSRVKQVGTVDRHVNKGGDSPHLLLPTPAEIERLVEKLRKMNLAPLSEEVSEVNCRSLRRRFTEEEIQELAARYRAGETISSLSRDLAVSRKALRSLLKAEGVSLRRRGMSQADADRAVQLYESGMTIAQVTEQVGYSYGVVNRMLHKRGVNVRPRRHQD